MSQREAGESAHERREGGAGRGAGGAASEPARPGLRGRIVLGRAAGVGIILCPVTDCRASSRRRLSWPMSRAASVPFKLERNMGGKLLPPCASTCPLGLLHREENGYKWSASYNKMAY